MFSHRNVQKKIHISIQSVYRRLHVSTKLQGPKSVLLTSKSSRTSQFTKPVTKTYPLTQYPRFHLCWVEARSMDCVVDVLRDLRIYKVNRPGMTSAHGYGYSAVLHGDCLQSAFRKPWGLLQVSYNSKCYLLIWGGIRIQQ